MKPLTFNPSAYRNLDAPPLPTIPDELHSAAKLHLSGIAGDGGQQKLYEICKILVHGFDLSFQFAYPLAHFWRTKWNLKWTDDEIRRNVIYADRENTGKPRGYLRPKFSTVSSPKSSRDHKAKNTPTAPNQRTADVSPSARDTSDP